VHAGLQPLLLLLLLELGHLRMLLLLVLLLRLLLLLMLALLLQVHRGRLLLLHARWLLLRGVLRLHHAALLLLLLLHVERHLLHAVWQPMLYAGCVVVAMLLRCAAKRARGVVPRLRLHAALLDAHSACSRRSSPLRRGDAE
jgi:hypothetical protein